MNVGLDIGSHGLRALWRQGDQLRTRQQPAFYAVLPEGGPQRRLLDQAGIPYAHCEDHLLLLGTAAVDYAEMFQTPLRPLFPGGTIPREDPLSRQILAAFIEHLLPRPHAPDDLCTFTIPAGLRQNDLRREQAEFLGHLIGLRGYQPQPMASGLGLILAELVSCGFSGVGLTFGAHSCDYTLAHQGREILSGSVPLGGSWIDDQLARRLMLTQTDPLGRRSWDGAAACRQKLACTGSLATPANELEQVLADVYAEMLGEVVRGIATRCRRDSALIPRPHAPLAVICAGGTARVSGFRELLMSAMEAAPWPFAYGAILPPALGPETIARGALIQAELETRARRQSRAA